MIKGRRKLIFLFISSLKDLLNVVLVQIGIKTCEVAEQVKDVADKLSATPIFCGRHAYVFLEIFSKKALVRGNLESMINISLMLFDVFLRSTRISKVT